MTNSHKMEAKVYNENESNSNDELTKILQKPDKFHVLKRAIAFLIFPLILFLFLFFIFLGFGQNNFFTALTYGIPIEEISFLNWLAPSADKFLAGRNDLPAFPFKGINSFNYFRKGNFENEPNVDLRYDDNYSNFINSNKYTLNIEESSNNILGNFHFSVGLNDFDAEFKRSFFESLNAILLQYSTFDLGADKIAEINKMLSTFSAQKKDNPKNYDIPEEIITKLDLQNFASTNS